MSVMGDNEDMKTHSTKHSQFKCLKCDYVADIEHELIQHMNEKHEVIQDLKFKCNLYTFQAERVVKLYEHKFSDHPEIPIYFNPNKMNMKDMRMIMHI